MGEGIRDSGFSDAKDENEKTKDYSARYPLWRVLFKTVGVAGGTKSEAETEFDTKRAVIDVDCVMIPDCI